MHSSQKDTLSDTVTERIPRRSPYARLAYASLSGAFALLPDAYQGRDLPDTYLPGALGFPSKNRADFPNREAP